MAIQKAIIAVDFDGTVVTHEYPEMGRDAGAVPVLRELAAKGHRIILYTMRSGKLLEQAEEWFRQHEIQLYAVNCNPRQKDWTASPKVYADIYIDDCALGCPQRIMDGAVRPVVDWVRVRQMLAQEGLLD